MAETVVNAAQNIRRAQTPATGKPQAPKPEQFAALLTQVASEIEGPEALASETARAAGKQIDDTGPGAPPQENGPPAGSSATPTLDAPVNLALLLAQNQLAAGGQIASATRESESNEPVTAARTPADSDKGARPLVATEASPAEPGGNPWTNQSTNIGIVTADSTNQGQTKQDGNPAPAVQPPSRSERVRSDTQSSTHRGAEENRITALRDVETVATDTQAVPIKREPNHSQSPGEGFNTTPPLTLAASVANRMETAPAHPSNPTLPVVTPFGTAGWAEEVGQSMRLMISEEIQSADLVLTPPDLGRIEVTIELQGDHATAFFVSPSPEVRTALEDSLPRLRDMMAAEGITLGDASVDSRQNPRDESQSRSQFRDPTGRTKPNQEPKLSVGSRQTTGIVDTFI